MEVKVTIKTEPQTLIQSELRSVRRLTFSTLILSLLWYTILLATIFFIKTHNSLLITMYTSLDNYFQAPLFMILCMPGSWQSWDLNKNCSKITPFFGKAFNTPCVYKCRFLTATSSDWEMWTPTKTECHTYFKEHEYIQ